MRVKVLSLAVLVSIMALPVPASQMLAASFSAPAAVARVVPGDANLSFLLRDPFLIDEMSLVRPASHLALDTALRAAEI